MDIKNNSIDFVISWVDGSDEKWITERDKYLTKKVSASDGGECRYRDWGILKYWFRSVECYAPWVRKIYLVTCGQVPDFLDIDNPRLVLVSHNDYMPDRYLPTFCSRPIELNLHRIKGLSEQFVYFNDDFFINQPCKPEDFFVKDKPCYLFYHTKKDTNLLQTAANSAPENCMKILNKHFTKWNTISRGLNKMFSLKYGKKALRNVVMFKERKFQAFPCEHVPVPILKSTMQDVWEHEYETVDSTSMHKFRCSEDVNSYIFRFWDLARGNFIPYLPNNKDYSINTKCLQDCVSDIKNANHKFICINDNEYCDDYDMCRNEIVNAFDSRFPQKSAFEK